MHVLSPRSKCGRRDGKLLIKDTLEHGGKGIDSSGGHHCLPVHTAHGLPDTRLRVVLATRARLTGASGIISGDIS